jgi:two-component system, NarL family, invasion response regulator UvrY
MRHGETPPVTVLLVDDHAVVREGYRRLLERHGDIVVLGEATDGAEAYALFCRLAPQIVVMDISLPGDSGIQTMRRMLEHDPGTRVLIFSMHEDVIFAQHALQAGAFAYVTKASAPAVLVEAVHAVAGGTRYLSPDVAQTLALRGAPVDEAARQGLSPRELEVLHLLVQGQSIKDIAQAMGIHPKTVSNHQSVIRQKLGADTPIQLLRMAKKLGLEPKH